MVTVGVAWRAGIFRLVVAHAEHADLVGAKTTAQRVERLELVTVDRGRCHQGSPPWMVTAPGPPVRRLPGTVSRCWSFESPAARQVATLGIRPPVRPSMPCGQLSGHGPHRRCRQHRRRSPQGQPGSRRSRTRRSCPDHDRPGHARSPTEITSSNPGSKRRRRIPRKGTRRRLGVLMVRTSHMPMREGVRAFHPASRPVNADTAHEMGGAEMLAQLRFGHVCQTSSRIWRVSAVICAYVA